MFRSGAKNKNQKQAKPKPLRIRTNDNVVVLSGNDKGPTPRKVLQVLPREGKVVVEGVNVMQDRQKARPQSGRAAGINQQDAVPKPFPIHASKVALFDPQTKKPTRLKMKLDANGKRVRAASKSGETI